MSNEPLIDPTDLGTYLKDNNLDVDRAAMLIDDAQRACETVINPVPQEAAWIVKRIAGRAYVDSPSPRQTALMDGGSPYGGSSAGGVRLYNEDRDDLQAYLPQGLSGEAFTIRLNPPTQASVSAWPYW